MIAGRHREKQRGDHRYARHSPLPAGVVEEVADCASERRALLCIPAFEDVRLEAAKAWHPRDVVHARGRLQRLADHSRSSASSRHDGQPSR